MKCLKQEILLTIILLLRAIFRSIFVLNFMRFKSAKYFFRDYFTFDEHASVNRKKEIIIIINK